MIYRLWQPEHYNQLQIRTSIHLPDGLLALTVKAFFEQRKEVK